MGAVTQQHNVMDHNHPVDYHSHILPALDDGSTSMEMSVEMARLLVRAGYTTVHCTPHLIRGMYEATTDQVHRAITELQTELHQQKIPLRLLAGREYYLDEYCAGYAADPLLLEGTNLMMVEIPSHASEELVKQTLFTIVCKGHTPLIAHAERCALLAVQAEPEGFKQSLWAQLFNSVKRKEGEEPEGTNQLLAYLKTIGCRFQLNLPSLHGYYGSLVERMARQHLASGLYSHAGTDAHTPQMLTSLLAKKG